MNSRSRSDKSPAAAEASAWFRGRKVLVTGGAGFIGSNLVIRLSQAGADVTVVDSMDPGCGASLKNLAPVHHQIRVIDADIADPESFRAEIRDAATIFNLAGEISHSRSMTEPERDLRTNTLAQLRFLLACRELCRGVRVVYAGTRQVYGRPMALPVDEEHPVRPVDFNGVHKYAATQYHLLLASYGDLDAVVLRLSNVYGPRMALHLPQQGFLSVFVNSALNGLPLLVYGDGTQLRDPLHVDDAVNAFLLAGSAATLDRRTFNIGGEEALSVRDIATVFSRYSTGSTVSEVPFPRNLRQIDIGSYCSASALARRYLNWAPRIGFEEGVRDTLDWYRMDPGSCRMEVAPDSAGTAATHEPG